MLVANTRAPLLLGVVLGRIAETNLFVSTQAYGDFAWLARPGVIIIGLIMLASLFYPMFQDRRERRRQQHLAAMDQQPLGQPGPADDC